jgi:hypothetical protein
MMNLSRKFYSGFSAIASPLKIYAKQVINQNLGIRLDSTEKRLWGMKNIHKRKRCFVIGNGPSLLPSDLAVLHLKNEFCIASNRIHLIFPETDWRPQYYGIEDVPTAKAVADSICDSGIQTIFYASYLEQYFAVPNRNTVGFRLLPRVQPPIKPRFSMNAIKGFYCGGSITYTLLQIAYWLGFEEVVLLGVDASYFLPNLKSSTEYLGLQTYDHDQRNYFVKDYVKKGEHIVAPDLESSLLAFASASDFCEKSRRFKIYNATRGGKLEVFERVGFDSLF